MFENKSIYQEYNLFSRTIATINKNNFVRVDALPNIEKITVRIDNLINASKEDADFIYKSALMMESCLNSKDFQRRAVNPPFVLEFTNGLSSFLVYDKVRSGSTDLQPEQDRTVNLQVTIYYARFSRTIGYTYPNTVMQWFNRKFLWKTNQGMATLSGNLMHEYCHKCGFTHQVKGYTRMNVPYYYGDVVRDMILKELI